MKCHRVSRVWRALIMAPTRRSHSRIRERSEYFRDQLIKIFSIKRRTSDEWRRLHLLTTAKEQWRRKPYSQDLNLLEMEPTHSSTVLDHRILRVLSLSTLTARIGLGILPHRQHKTCSARVTYSKQQMCTNSLIRKGTYMRIDSTWRLVSIKSNLRRTRLNTRRRWSPDWMRMSG